MLFAGLETGNRRKFCAAIVTVGAMLITATLILFIFSPATVARAQTDNQAKVTQSVPDTVAFDMEIDALASAFTNTAKNLEQHQKTKSSALSEWLWLIAGAGLLTVVVLVKYIPGLLEVRDITYQARLAAAKAAVQVVPQMAKEEQAFSDFAASFSSGPAERLPEANALKTRASKEQDSVIRTEKSSATSENISVATSEARAGTSTTKPAVGKARSPMAAVEKIVNEMQAATREVEKQNLLADLAREAASLKHGAEASKLSPLWKIASALEALAQQLMGKPYSLTPSTLRTISAAVDLMQSLSEPGVRTDLLENPPIRVLAVDDDPISRHAISFTLKKALNLPELANNGADGLELAILNAYDAIFLDVQMPGLNGFDLCVKIRNTDTNRATPVVFITCQSDFNARTRSSVVGGQDLIVKPFLTFEVALKALTTVIQHRLHRDTELEVKPPAPVAESEAIAAV